MKYIEPEKFVESAKPYSMERVKDLFFSCKERKYIDIKLFQVKLKCVQTLSSIYQHPDLAVSTPFIHSAGIVIMEFLLGVSSQPPTTDLQVTLINESVGMVEVLVKQASEQTRKTNL